MNNLHSSVRIIIGLYVLVTESWYHDKVRVVGKPYKEYGTINCK